jgi:hypothetical protein
MGIKRIFIILLLFLFVLPVIAAIGWDVSELVLLSSMAENLGHIGEGISVLFMLSSVRYGDVDNNTLVESFDASLVLQYFCLMEPQGVPLPWEEWRQTISDVDGNMEIEAYDASLILQFSVDLIDIFPVEEVPFVTRKDRRTSTAEGAESAEKEKTIHFRRK